MILWMIVFNAPGFKDGRDKLIELKADRIDHMIFVVGFVAAMAVTAMFLAFAVSGRPTTSVPYAFTAMR